MQKKCFPKSRLQFLWLCNRKQRPYMYFLIAKCDNISSEHLPVYHPSLVDCVPLNFGGPSLQSMRQTF